MYRFRLIDRRSIGRIRTYSALNKILSNLANNSLCIFRFMYIGGGIYQFEIAVQPFQRNKAGSIKGYLNSIFGEGSFEFI